VAEREESRRATAGQMDALLAFLPLMRVRVAGTWEGGNKLPGGAIQMPWFAYSDEVLDFMRACGANNWIVVYPWPEWQEEALRYYKDPGLLAQADVETIRKLLTLHIRKDRFSEGHLAGMVEEGHIEAILERLAEIRRELR